MTEGSRRPVLTDFRDHAELGRSPYWSGFG